MFQFSLLYIVSTFHSGNMNKFCLKVVSLSHSYPQWSCNKTLQVLMIKLSFELHFVWFKVNEMVRSGLKLKSL